jgi:hypothetical protein
MRSGIQDTLRKEVAKRAGFRCEYCCLPEPYALYPFEVDHIIAVKHGGNTLSENLAYCCIRCNRAKGSDLTSVLPGSDIIVPLFNPRKDTWSEHFYISEGRILGKTPVGAVTAQLLQFNTPERIIGRILLLETGDFS